MLITIFTPTYNRENLLERLYNSLCCQSYLDFEWLIVDDGSTDNTETVIRQLKLSHNLKFPIRYIKKENGGKHTAINEGVKHAMGELFFIADSDDVLPSRSLEIVSNEYKKVKSNPKIGAIVGFDEFMDGKKVAEGSFFSTLNISFVDFLCKYNYKGDMKEVFRTSILKEIPFPEIEGEKFCPEDLEWLRISKKYIYHYFNKIIYTVEYQPDGLTANIIKIRKESPILTTWYYALYNTFDIPIIKRMKNAINYWRFYFCITDRSRIVKNIGFVWGIFKLFGYIMYLKDKRV